MINIKEIVEAVVQTIVKVSNPTQASRLAQEFENSGAGQADVSGSHIELSHTDRQIDQNVVRDVMKMFGGRRVKFNKKRSQSEPQPRDLQAHVDLPRDKTLIEDLVRRVSYQKMANNFERVTGMPLNKRNLKRAETHTNPEMQEIAKKMRQIIIQSQAPQRPGQTTTVS